VLMTVLLSLTALGLSERPMAKGQKPTTNDGFVQFVEIVKFTVMFA
jgi:hypothetical protein